MGSKKYFSLIFGEKLQVSRWSRNRHLNKASKPQAISTWLPALRQAVYQYFVATYTSTFSLLIYIDHHSRSSR
jgi:hypothetical protein